MLALPFTSDSLSTQVLVQPQIIKTDSLVLTTLKADGNPVVAAVQNPALTALTAPIQTTALQVPGGPSSAFPLLTDIPSS